MSISIFIDKKVQPTDAEVIQAIGPRLAIWQEFISYIQSIDQVQQDFKFLYGKKYGWAYRYRIKGKLLASLYPGNGGFTVQVNLSPEAIEKAQAMDLSENIQKAILHAYPYPEGRWLFVPVESDQDIQDIKQLITLRINTRLI